MHTDHPLFGRLANEAGKASRPCTSKDRFPAVSLAWRMTESGPITAAHSHVSKILNCAPFKRTVVLATDEPSSILTELTLASRQARQRERAFALTHGQNF
jgi:hypothetical protein